MIAGNVYIVVRDKTDTYRGNDNKQYISAHSDESVAQEKCDAINTYEKNLINPILTLPEEQLRRWENLEEAFHWATDENYDSEKDYEKEEAEMYIKHGYDATMVQQYMEWKKINESGLGPAYYIKIPFDK